MAQKCDSPGDADSDIAGLGIITAFAIQAGISVFLSIWATKMVISNEASECQHQRDSPIALKVKSARHMVESIAALQSVTGISLLIAALSKWEELSLYHYHVIYDVVSFTGVSYIASLFHLWSKVPEDWQQSKEKETMSRACAVISFFTSQTFYYISFAILYIIFLGMFGSRLQHWDDGQKGSCYHYKWIAWPNSSHPKVDKVYLYTTGSCMLLSIMGCILLTDFSSKVKDHLSKYVTVDIDLPDTETGASNPPSRARWVWEGFMTVLSLLVIFLIYILRAVLFISGLLLYIVHLYVTIGLRESNKGYLGGSENQWGFGQVIALVLLFPIVKECGQEYVQYWVNRKKWEEGVIDGSIRPLANLVIYPRNSGKPTALRKRLYKLYKAQNPGTEDVAYNVAIYNLLSNAGRGGAAA